MKKIFTLAILVVMCVAAMAQDIMKVTKVDGSAERFVINNIADIAFDSSDIVPFEISISDLKADGVTVTVTTSDDSQFFFWDICTAEELQSNSVDEVAKSYMKSYVDKCNKNHVPLSAYYIYKGSDSYTYTLKPDTRYVAFACYCTADGALTTECEVLAFATPKLEQIPFTANFSWNASTSTLSVSPSDKSVSYWLLYAHEDELKNENGNITNASISTYFDKVVEEMGAYVYYITFSGDINDELDVVNLTPGTNYALICACSANTRISQISAYKFTVPVIADNKSAKISSKYQRPDSVTPEHKLGERLIMKPVKRSSEFKMISIKPAPLSNLKSESVNSNRKAGLLFRK